MRTKTTEPEDKLQREIDALLDALDEVDADQAEYAYMVDQLVKLHKMKLDETPSRVSKDTVAIIAANLIGILIIVGHEHTGIITSKAMNLVLKPK